MDDVVGPLFKQEPSQCRGELYGPSLISTRQDTRAKGADFVVIFTRPAHVGEEVHLKLPTRVTQHVHQPRLDAPSIHPPEHVKDPH